MLTESDDLVIFGVTFDSKMTFEKYLRSVSRAASQGDRRPFKLTVLVISIVIDCDRGHCYEHFQKKNLIPMKIEPVTYISMFVYAMNFELPEDQKVKFWTFSDPTCLS